MTTAPASESRRHGPAIPRWMLPTVRVRRRGDVITVEQRVPARVESTRSTSSGISSGRIRYQRRIPIYESGLGLPTALALVKERLTVPADAADEQQVRQTIESAIAAYDPGTATLSRQINRDALTWLLRAVTGVLLTAFGIYFSTSLTNSDLPSAPGTIFAFINGVLLVGPLIFIVMSISIAVFGVRAAWALRTPKFVAEEQWGLLRQTLTRLTGQDPGSSRPLDVEAGLRRDLITHPHGSSSARGVTRDGRMGPLWPDAYDVSRSMRRGRRTLVGMTIFASIPLAVGVLVCVLTINAGQPTFIPLIFCTGFFGIFVSVSLKGCDRLIISYPDTMPGGTEPRTITWEDVDVPSLPTWCDARRRERYWNLVATMFAVEILVAGLAFAVAVMRAQAMFTARISSEEAESSAVMFNSAFILAVIAAAAGTVVVGRLWIRQKDSELRRRAGIA
ncbi:hypothetical protein E4J66_12700 [Actinomyces viscosus]|uniref:Uncharacterized protein n=1 Tax=Actinomyces viscosus TaxID=1656 RepID=A0A448PJC8_ACTVI|nr:hypothetical protein [Actinomyces viscosus]TFH51239.1 hypothetical protein E4J66_12700 [Actinomyces viscosus]VEI15024.1 Uncharacterised protein [Actinomyces viscosus]